MRLRKLELLSPAANKEIAIQAILHGADAVYIGPPSHGARKSAANSLKDIEEVVDFAHQFRARVYATVNTIVYDNEIGAVERLCRDLYHKGVDALIVQDMGILRMKIPPIALHASTQCDIRTPEKAKFLQEVGFSQLVLARELTLKEIREITERVTIPVETFIHGALCVSYSGRCHASLALTGRSANRGECAQICRLPFTLSDSNGEIISKDKYLLSLKDFNAYHNLEDLISAGVSSFKIEGRLKDLEYVKNITSLYNIKLNKIISHNYDKYQRSSFGEVSLKFNPKADKSFNRGFSNYFLEDRKPLNVASLLSPKSQGEKINNISELNNGDGISFFDSTNKFTGVHVNKIEETRIIPGRKIEIPKNATLYRTHDVKWERLLASDTATRKIPLTILLDNEGVTAKDGRGLEVRLPLDLEFENSRKEMNYKNVFEKLGNTIYSLKHFDSTLDTNRFYRISELTDIRRKLLKLLDSANLSTFPCDYRKEENLKYPYPAKSLDFRDNVANKLAEAFYCNHGVEEIQKAAEVSNSITRNEIVMTTRHCVLRELGMCLKEKGKPMKKRLPLYLQYDGGKFRLDFDCACCEMKVLKD